MARLLIKKMEKIEKERTQVHDLIEATYSVFTKDGIKYLQIDTYGSPTRKIKNRVSQIIQLDEQNAMDLVSIIIKEFGTKK